MAIINCSAIIIYPVSTLWAKLSTISGMECYNGYQTSSELEKTSKLVHCIVSKNIRGGKGGGFCYSPGIYIVKPGPRAQALQSVCYALPLRLKKFGIL